MKRLGHAWRALEHEQRLAVYASLGLSFSMVLPWYSKTDTFVEHGVAKAAQTSSNAFQAFSFVEAAVLLVSAGVLVMLFARSEGRDFHLPGGDGLIVMIAGGWTALLIFYRLLDKPGLQSSQRITATVGVEWGIFIALLVALGLVYAGARMRAAERPGPPATRSRRPRQGGDDPEPRRRPPEESLTAVVPAPARPGRSAPVPADRGSSPRRPRYPPPPGEQMSFEDRPADAE
jgi:hypothetical protein